MCYNIAFLEKRLGKYTERYNNVIPPDWSDKNTNKELPVYYFVSGFSNPQLPIIKHDGISMYEWGLIPFWTKNAQFANDIKSKTLNAVGETVFEKPSYKNSVRSKRCLLGVNGFFEWHTHNNTKYPFFIKTKDNNVFSLGCIYEAWTDKETGEVKNTFSIITTPANSLMEKVHNVKKRMPLIISAENEHKWINPELNPQQIKELIKPYDQSNMTAYPVSRDLNYSKKERNTPDALEEVDYPELQL